MQWPDEAKETIMAGRGRAADAARVHGQPAGSRRTTDTAIAGQPSREVRIIPFEMASAGDASGVRDALRALPLARVLQLAVVAKVEGTATLNDASRELASACIGVELRRAGGEALAARTLEILSVGCEGVITPGGWLFASLRPDARAKAASLRGEAGAEGLAIGQARSAPVAMRDRAGPRHVQAAERAVRAAMREAGLDSKSVSFVLIKSPVLMPGTTVTLDAAQRRHVGSTGASRGAAALGAAIALGEIPRGPIDASRLCAEGSLHGSRTLSFSGTETECCEAVVIGHRPGGDPRWRASTTVLRDLLDSAALSTLAGDPGSLHAVFFKAGIAAGGRLRGARTTVLSSELPADKQLRAAASGVVGAVLGTTRAFISGGAEHQAAPGACLAAVIRAV
jgi:cyanuric acid amidohydrolase